MRLQSINETAFAVEMVLRCSLIVRPRIAIEFISSSDNPDTIVHVCIHKSDS